MKLQKGLIAREVARAPLVRRCKERGWHYASTRIENKVLADTTRRMRQCADCGAWYPE